MKLIEARAKHNLSQSGLADLIGMTQGQISNIEIGKSFPHAANRYKMEQALKCKIDWIATKLSDGSQNLNTVLENESSENKIIREMELYIESAPKAEQPERAQFILNYMARKKRKNVLMDKIHRA